MVGRMRLGVFVMNMKRMICLILVAVLVLGLVSGGIAMLIGA